MAFVTGIATGGRGVAVCQSAAMHTFYEFFYRFRYDDIMSGRHSAAAVALATGVGQDHRVGGGFRITGA